MTELFPCEPLGELVVSVSDTHPMSKDRLIFLNTSDIYGGKLLHKDYTQVAYWPGQAKKSVALNDILFSEIRPANGRWALIKEPAEDIVVSTKLMVIRADPAKLLAEFLYLFVTSDNITGWLQHLAESRSGTFPQITFDQVASLQIPLPPLPEQRRIAHILGTLDDKIENNRKMAKTLEAMAQAIFKSLFVDFDPVRAKMAGESRESICKRLKLTPEILDLFPDRLVDSELGEIPEGWETRIIIDLATISSGKRPENRLEYPSEDANIPLWGGNGPIGFVTEPLIHEPCILTGRVGTLGTFFRIDTPCWPSDNTLIIRARSKTYYEFIFFNLAQLDITLLNRGSTQPLLTQSDLGSQPIIVPTLDAMKAFHDISYNILQYTSICSLESHCTALIRDSILPKLISGVIRVPEAEDRVEGALP